MFGLRRLVFCVIGFLCIVKTLESCDENSECLIESSPTPQLIWEEVGGCGDMCSTYEAVYIGNLKDAYRILWQKHGEPQDTQDAEMHDKAGDACPGIVDPSVIEEFFYQHRSFTTPYSDDSNNTQESGYESLRYEFNKDSLQIKRNCWGGGGFEFRLREIDGKRTIITQDASAD